MKVNNKIERDKTSFYGKSRVLLTLRGVFAGVFRRVCFPRKDLTVFVNPLHSCIDWYRKPIGGQIW